MLRKNTSLRHQEFEADDVGGLLEEALKCNKTLTSLTLYIDSTSNGNIIRHIRSALCSNITLQSMTIDYTDIKDATHKPLHPTAKLRLGYCPIKLVIIRFDSN